MRLIPKTTSHPRDYSGCELVQGKFFHQAIQVEVILLLDSLIWPHEQTCRSRLSRDFEIRIVSSGF